MGRIALVFAWTLLALGLVHTTRADAPVELRMSILDTGAVADGTTINTQAIQSAIDQLTAKGGGTLMIPAGNFKSGAIFLGSNVNLAIEKDGQLLGSTNIEDYPLCPTRIEGQLRTWRPALVNASKSSRLRITGPGTIRGGGKPYWDLFWKKLDEDSKTRNLDVHRPRNIYIEDSTDVQISDLNLRDSGFWNLHLYRCKDVTIQKTNIQAPKRSPSTDGIDIDSCQNVDIRGCYISVNDDNIAIKGTKGPTADQDTASPAVEHVRVSDCTFALGHGVLTLGSEAVHVRDVVIENCKVDGKIDGNRSILVRFKLRPDTPQHYEDIHFNNIAMNVNGSLVSIEPWTQYFDLEDQKAPSQLVENISISNITGSATAFGTIAGPRKTTIRNIRFENIDLKLKNARPTFRKVQNLDYKNVVINGQELKLMDGMTGEATTMPTDHPLAP